MLSETEFSSLPPEQQRRYYEAALAGARKREEQMRALDEEQAEAMAAAELEKDAEAAFVGPREPDVRGDEPFWSMRTAVKAARRVGDALVSGPRKAAGSVVNLAGELTGEDYEKLAAQVAGDFEGETFPEWFAEGAAQFIAGFAPAFAALRGAGGLIAPGMAAKDKRIANWFVGAPLAEGIAMGAAFDPRNTPTFSQFLKEQDWWPEQWDGLLNDWLAEPYEKDGEGEQRLRQVFEGAAIGGFMSAVGWPMLLAARALMNRRGGTPGVSEIIIDPAEEFFPDQAANMLAVRQLDARKKQEGSVGNPFRVDDAELRRQFDMEVLRDGERTHKLLWDDYQIDTTGLEYWHLRELAEEVDKIAGSGMSRSEKTEWLESLVAKKLDEAGPLDDLEEDAFRKALEQEEQAAFGRWKEQRNEGGQQDLAGLAALGAGGAALSAEDAQGKQPLSYDVAPYEDWVNEVFQHPDEEIQKLMRELGMFRALNSGINRGKPLELPKDYQRKEKLLEEKLLDWNKENPDSKPISERLLNFLIPSAEASPASALVRAGMKAAAKRKEKVMREADKIHLELEEATQYNESSADEEWLNTLQEVMDSGDIDKLDTFVKRYRGISSAGRKQEKLRNPQWTDARLKAEQELSDAYEDDGGAGMLKLIQSRPNNVEKALYMVADFRMDKRGPYKPGIANEIDALHPVIDWPKVQSIVAELISGADMPPIMQAKKGFAMNATHRLAANDVLAAMRSAFEHQGLDTSGWKDVPVAKLSDQVKEVRKEIKEQFENMALWEVDEEIKRRWAAGDIQYLLAAMVLAPFLGAENPE